MFLPQADFRPWGGVDPNSLGPLTWYSGHNSRSVESSPPHTRRGHGHSQHGLGTRWVTPFLVWHLEAGSSGWMTLRPNLPQNSEWLCFGPTWVARGKRWSMKEELVSFQELPEYDGCHLQQWYSGKRKKTHPWWTPTTYHTKKSFQVKT